jgi:transposase, IS6 family
MLLASSVSGLFKWRQFEPKVILLAVGWYLRFSLSYVDETYIRVKGKWVYLYRAVDSTGATIDFLLSAKRDAAAAERFLAKALGGENHPEPRVINTDKHAVYSPAIAGLQAAGDLTDNCQHRPVQYLNNVLEQDHRAIKRRVRASQHFRSFWGAWRTIAGYEAIHMMRKDQARGSAPAPTVGLLHRFILGLFAARSKFPIIYIDLRIDYKVATHPSPVRTAPILHAHRRVWSSRTW